MKFLVSLFLLWGLSFSNFASDLPHHIDISYSVQTGIGQGKLSETVEIIQEADSHRYNITSEAQAIGIMKIIKPGSITRNSRGFITEEGLKPTRFSDQRGNKEPSIAYFDWENNLITLHRKGKKTQKPLPTGTLDRLSLSYSFMFKPVSGKVINVNVTDGRSLKLTRFTVHEEILDTPIGKLDTIVLTKQPKRNSKVTRKIWLATSHYMLPVRIVATEKDGLELEKMVSEINIKHANNH
jgi:uncharacterized protein DUF3108